MPTSFLVSLLLPYPPSTYLICAHPTQRRYRIVLPILLNICGTTLDPLTLMCLPKSRLNQTSYSTGPPRLSHAARLMIEGIEARAAMISRGFIGTDD